MIPIHISVRGLPSYPQQEEIQFDQASIWALAGPSRESRNPLFDAITYALFGCYGTMAENSTELMDHTCDSILVEFEFSVEKAAYCVRRTLDRQGNTTRCAWRLLPAEPGAMRYSEVIASTDVEGGFADWVRQTVGPRETFTASVLLEQPPIENMSPKQKQENPTPATAAVPAQDKVLSAAEAKYEAAEQNLERLLKTSDAISQRDYLEYVLAEKQQRLAEHQRLIERGDEIEAGHARWQELNAVSPILWNIYEQAKTLSWERDRVKSIQDSIARIAQETTGLEMWIKQSETTESQCLADLVEAYKQAPLLENRLTMLAPMLAHAERYRYITQERHKAETDLLNFPVSLSADIEYATQEQLRILDAERNLPWLQLVYEKRLELAKASAQHHAATDGLRPLYQARQQRLREQERLHAEITAAQSLEHTLQTALALSEQRFNDQAEDDLASSPPVAAESICGSCEQRTNQSQADDEFPRLAMRLKEGYAAVERAQAAYADIQSRVRTLTQEHTELGEQLDSLAFTIDLKEDILNSAQSAMASCSNILGIAFGALPYRYCRLIAYMAPGNAQGWIETSYPSEADLSELLDLVDKQADCATRLQSLREQESERKRALDKRDAMLAELEQMETAHSYEEVLEALKKQPILQQQQIALREKLVEYEQDYKRARETIAKERRSYRGWADALVAEKYRLIERQTKSHAAEQQLQSARLSLPPEWQLYADSGFPQLRAWAVEEERLARYKSEAQALSEARLAAAALQADIRKLERQIKKLPELEGLSAEAVERECIAASQLCFALQPTSTRNAM